MSEEYEGVLRHQRAAGLRDIDHVQRKKDSDRLRELERTMAEELAHCDVESFCTSHVSQGHTWFDLDSIADDVVDARSIADVARAVEYLDLRGLLLRSTKHKSWVRYRGSDEG